jgi:hypothetical protein
MMVIRSKMMPFDDDDRQLAEPDSGVAISRFRGWPWHWRQSIMRLRPKSPASQSDHASPSRPTTNLNSLDLPDH